MDAMDVLLFTSGTGLKPLPDVDYVGMTKREVYDKLVELDDPYISIRGTTQAGEEVYLHSAGSYFHSWEDLVSDSLFMTGNNGASITGAEVAGSAGNVF